MITVDAELVFERVMMSVFSIAYKKYSAIKKLQIPFKKAQFNRSYLKKC